MSIEAEPPFSQSLRENKNLVYVFFETREKKKKRQYVNIDVQLVKQAREPLRVPQAVIETVVLLKSCSLPSRLPDFVYIYGFNDVSK